MNLKRSIAINLAKNDLTQQELARKIGVTQAQISGLVVRGTCTTNTLERLATAFNLTVSEFIAVGES